MPEFQGRATLRIRPFPLELIDGESAPRDILEQEWWLAAIQEPAAAFVPYRGDDWPTTTLPAFEAAWCAGRQGEQALADYDLRVRHVVTARCVRSSESNALKVLLVKLDLLPARCEVGGIEHEGAVAGDPGLASDGRYDAGVGADLDLAQELAGVDRAEDALVTERLVARARPWPTAWPSSRTFRFRRGTDRSILSRWRAR